MLTVYNIQWIRMQVIRYQGNRFGFLGVRGFSFGMKRMIKEWREQNAPCSTINVLEAALPEMALACKLENAKIQNLMTIIHKSTFILVY